MKASAWLAALAAVLPGDHSPRRTSTLRQFGAKLALDIPDRCLDNELAEAVAKRMVAGAVISYPVLLRAVREALAERPDIPDHGGSATRAPGGLDGHSITDSWIRYVRGRLVQGGPRSHLLSLLRAYVPQDGYRRAMMAVFPTELAEEDAAQARRKADMAAATQQVAERTAREAQMPPLTRQRAITTRPAPPQHPTRPREAPVSRDELIASYQAQAKRDGAIGALARTRLDHLLGQVAPPTPSEPPPPTPADYFQGHEDDAR
jgi:hypothetical protein